MTPEERRRRRKERIKKRSQLSKEELLSGLINENLSESVKNIEASSKTPLFGAKNFFWTKLILLDLKMNLKEPKNEPPNNFQEEVQVLESIRKSPLTQRQKGKSLQNSQKKENPRAIHESQKRFSGVRFSTVFDSNVLEKKPSRRRVRKMVLQFFQSLFIRYFFSEFCGC